MNAFDWVIVGIVVVAGLIWWFLSSLKPGDFP